MDRKKAFGKYTERPYKYVQSTSPYLLLMHFNFSSKDVLMAFRNPVVKRNILSLLTVKLKFAPCNMLLGALREFDGMNLNGAH